MPDWGKIEFRECLPRPWAEALQDAPQAARELVGSLVKYSGRQRRPAEKILASSELLNE
jgi:hypothetical protein